MKFRVGIILLLTAFCAGLITLAPASLIEGPANRALAPHAALNATAGRIWSGTAILTFFPNANVVAVPVSWRFDPVALLRLRLGFYINANSAEIAGITHLGAGFNSIELRDTDMKIDSVLVTRFNSLLGLLGPRGALQLNIKDGERIITPYQAVQGVRSAEGRFVALVDRLALQSFSPRPIGTYEIAIHLKNTTAEFQFINATGPLKFDGGGAIEWGQPDARTFMYQGMASAPRESAILLAPLLGIGKPTLDGRLRIDYSTKW